MNVRIFPIIKLKGTVELPASKSYSVRAFLTAACGGKSRVVAPSDCDDALAAASVARQLGAVVKRRGKVWEVVAGARRENLSAINVKESGTVLRMLLPLVALRNQKAKILGEGTLRGRPNAHLIKTLQQLGILVEGSGRHHSIPIRFSGGNFSAGKVAIDGSLSSQFVSALLMACPQLSEDSVIRVTGKKIVSVDYIAMTIQVLKKAGVHITREDLRTYRIKGGQQYKGLKSFHVPSDYGLAAFLMAAGALTDSCLTLTGSLDDKLIQADGHIMRILKKMGVRFEKTARSIKVCGPFQLKGGKFSLKDCPDLLPILCILALFADKPTTFIHIEHVRVKESDRITDLAKELNKVGARTQERRDSMTIFPLKETECKHNVVLDPHHDHRLAMAFCILGLRLGTKVEGVECVAKSYPKFLTDLRALGVSVNKY